MLDANQVLLDTLLRLLPSVSLYLLVFRNFYRFSKKITIFSACGFLLIFCFMPGCLFALYQGLDPWLRMYSILFLFILIISAFLFVRFSPFQQLLVLFLLENYVANISLLCDALFQKLLYFLPSLTYYPNAIYLRLVLELFLFPIFALFFIRLVQPIVEIDQDQPYHKYLWLIPASFFVIFRLCILPDESTLNFDVNGFSLGLAMVWCLGTFIVYALIFKMLQEMISQVEDRQRLERNAMNASIQMKLYETLLDQIKESRRAIHDFRHHLFMIKNYCDHKQYDELKDYLDEYSGSLSFQQQWLFCEHPMINGLLQYYYAMALEQHITCQIAFSLPKQLLISDADICTLLGNALENAIEACSRQSENERIIHAKAELFHDSILAITIQNTYSGEIRKNKTGAFLSSKRNEEGIGVTSIQNIVQKYDGVCKIGYDDTWFTLSMMLIIKK